MQGASQPAGEKRLTTVLRRTMIAATGTAIVVAACLFATSWALEPAPAGPAGAPDPSDFSEPVIQVYGANVWGWRGRFAIHTWLAIKPRDAATYTIYEVIGWRLRRTGSALRVSDGDPARSWFGSPAILLHDVRGRDAARLVEHIHAAVESYPYEREYTMWPGPNSNSFVAWLALEVPELGLVLPAKAIGQSWMQQNYTSARRGD